MHKWFNRLVLAITLIATQISQAGLTTGSVGITGRMILNPASAGTATDITSWVNAAVTTQSGTFAVGPFALTNQMPINFTTHVWNFQTATLLTNFFTVGGFTFKLLSSQVLAQGNGFMAVQGIGVISGNGFTPTLCDWSFVTQDPAVTDNPKTWTFSAVFSSSTNEYAPVLVLAKKNNSVILNWDDPTYMLQSAPSLTDTFSNIPTGSSPFTNNLNGSSQFFRLEQ